MSRLAVEPPEPEHADGTLSLTRHREPWRRTIDAFKETTRLDPKLEAAEAYVLAIRRRNTLDIDGSGRGPHCDRPRDSRSRVGHDPGCGTEARDPRVRLCALIIDVTRTQGGTPRPGHACSAAGSRMLSKQDNEYLTRIGPGTPMGDLMRQYWIPAAKSDELRWSRLSDPLRVRLLGEDLIAFRDYDNQIGLIQNNCPHRGASLFFGRNEEAGLRCVYHGWKFAVDGSCVDMPNEPAESDFKSKVKAVAYPCVERNGVVWAYLGPRQTPPPLPDFEANMLGAGLVLHLHHSPTLQLDAGLGR